jgi:hypothetical protein
MNNATKTVMLFFGIAVFSLLGCGGGEPAEQTETVEETETETVDQGESTEVTPAAETGGANSAVDAIAIDVGTITGELETEENEDWYVFSVEGGETFELTFAPGDEAEAISFDVLNGELDCIWYESNVRPPVTQTFSYTTSAEVGGEYYVEVSQGQPGSYSIELSKQMQNDASSGIDAGNSAVHAIEIATDVSVEGQVGDLDESDWYVFEIPQGDIFTLTFTPGDNTESIDIDLLDSNLDCYWYESNVHPGVTANKTVIMSSSSGGTYYAEVSDGKGNYNLEVSLSSQNDAGIETDAGDRAVDAVPVELGNTYTGLLGDYDEQDWFSVEVAEGQIVGFIVTPGDDVGSLDVDIYSPEQENLDYESNVASGVTCEMSLPDDAAAGTYYLELSDGQGSYSFVIE